jgi:hypothetical protein
MLIRYCKSKHFKKIIIESQEDFIKIMKTHMKLYKYKCINKDLREYEIDKIIGKEILNHLHDFFNEKPKLKR